MGEHTPLRGSCSCGRYHYVVTIPADNAGKLQLYFATDNENRRSTSSLLTSYLRIPLPWYSSRTSALFPDETHNSISKTFVPPQSPHSQRKFCGYCGTHLSYWTEEPPSEQDYLQINVGSLIGKDLDALEQLGLLDDLNESAEDGETRTDNKIITIPTRTAREGRIGDLSWFEEMIDGSKLGRTSKTRRGHGQTTDGSTTISWEISEFNEDVDSTGTSGTTSTRAKRKIGAIAIDDDATMT